MVTVPSASDLPRLWQLPRGLLRLHLYCLSGAPGLASQGLWIPSWFHSGFVDHARVDVPTAHPAFVTRLA